MSTKDFSWVHGAAAMFALNFFQRGLSLVAISLLARVLDVPGFGAYAFTQSVAQSFASWSRLGLDAGTQVVLAASAARDQERAETIVGQSLFIALIMACGVGAGIAAGAGLIARQFFAKPELTSFVYPAALLFAGQTLFAAVYAIHAGLGEFPAYARAVMLGLVVSTVVTVGGGFIQGPLGASWGLAIAQLVTVAITTFSMRRLLSARGIGLRLHWPGRDAIEIMKRGLPFYAGALFIVPADFAAFSLLGRVGGVDALGELRVSQALMSVAASLPSALSAPMITHLTSRFAAGQGREAIRLQAKAIWIFALLIAIGFAAVWPIAVDIIFGKAFALARAVGDLGLMVFVATMLVSVMQGALLARGRAGGYFFVIGLIQAAALVAGSQLLTPRYGLAGYFVAQAFCYGLAAILTAAAFARTIRAPFWSLPLGAMTLALFASLIANVSLQAPLVTRLLAATFGEAITVSIVIVFVLHVDERARLKNLLKSPRLPWRASRASLP